jgi:DNA gyrase subunit A
VLGITQNCGKAIRFSEKDVRDMGRTARGVIGIRLAKGDIVVGMSAFKGEGHFLTVTERGFGKRTSVEEYPRTAGEDPGSST